MDHNRIKEIESARLADDGFVPRPKSSFSCGWSTREDESIIKRAEAAEARVRELKETVESMIAQCSSCYDSKWPCQSCSTGRESLANVRKAVKP